MWQYEYFATLRCVWLEKIKHIFRGSLHDPNSALRWHHYALIFSLVFYPWICFNGVTNLPYFVWYMQRFASLIAILLLVFLYLFLVLCFARCLATPSLYFRIIFFFFPIQKKLTVPTTKICMILCEQQNSIIKGYVENDNFSNQMWIPWGKNYKRRRTKTL